MSHQARRVSSPPGTSGGGSVRYKCPGLTFIRAKPPPDINVVTFVLGKKDPVRMWFHQSGSLEKNLSASPSPCPLSLILFFFTCLLFYREYSAFSFSSSSSFFFLYHFFLHSILSHVSHSPCKTGRDWTSDAQAGERCPALDAVGASVEV
jgi:hypothetical protein